MAENKNTAYDFSLFEPSVKELQDSKKKDNIIKISEEQLQHNRRKKYNPLTVLVSVFCSFVVLAVVGTMVYSQARLTELTAQITAASKSLDEQQSMNIQLSMKLENEYSLRTVEDYAKNELGMKTTEAHQIDYISLSEGDRAEIRQNVKERNLLDKIGDTISDLFS
ncbi:MAG: hypothetical protein HFE39_04675 [Clostridiales bacterium]|nr:hypothetical protein [Clostridiales bacterium]